MYLGTVKLGLYGRGAAQPQHPVAMRRMQPRRERNSRAVHRRHCGKWKRGVRPPQRPLCPPCRQLFLDAGAAPDGPRPDRAGDADRGGTGAAYLYRDQTVTNRPVIDRVSGNVCIAAYPDWGKVGKLHTLVAKLLGER